MMTLNGMETRRSLSARLASASVIALSLGVLTSYGQEWLPSQLGSLANSSGSWSLLAFGLALFLATGVRTAALIGLLALLALLAGYVFGASVRGYSSGVTLIAFWGAAALLAGPLIGIGAHWVRSSVDPRPAFGAGAMSGVLVGEGVYGVTFIADTTYTPYWWGEILVGLALAGWVVGRSRRRLRAFAVAGAVGTLAAVLFLAIYSQDLIAVLP